MAGNKTLLPSLFKFTWKVDGRGYKFYPAPKGEQKRASSILLGTPRVSDLALENERLGVIVRLGESADDLKEYTPPENLHRIFADSVFDAESALAFVEGYGFLGAMLGAADDRKESVSVYLSSAESFRTGLALLKKIQEKIKAKDRRLRRESPNGAGFQSKVKLAELFNNNVRPHMTLKIGFPDGDLSQPALQVEPRSLVSFMWLKFADEITGKGRWIKCDNDRCRKPVWVPGDDHRKDGKYYCGPNCKSNAHYHRNKDKISKARKKTRKNK